MPRDDGVPDHHRSGYVDVLDYDEEGFGELWVSMFVRLQAGRLYCYDPRKEKDEDADSIPEPPPVATNSTNGSHATTPAMTTATTVTGETLSTASAPAPAMTTATTVAGETASTASAPAPDEGEAAEVP